MSISRSAGILMPIFSLPSPYGIGTLGKKAYEFVDFLDKAKQKYWQLLPIGPTSYGDSPYASFSSYAGNPYFIDLDMLVEEGLLEKEDLLGLENSNRVDYGYIYNTRFPLLYKAYKKGIKKDTKQFEQFVNDNAKWLADYSLYMAVKKHFNMSCWIDWPDKDIRMHKQEAVEKYRDKLKDDVDYYSYIQYLFNKQYNLLREYANGKDIKIIGDMPIYVALDSADVWANPFCFQLDSVNIPVEVAGVPPDYFSKEGQLWGNPLYNWDSMKENGYKWWIDRIDGVSKYYDVVRIDHFRGFESYWAVKYGEKTAINGHWVKGPGIDFVKTITGWFHNVQFIAEDLGILTQDVVDMLKESGLPGMRVIEFGMDGTGKGSNTPCNYIPNSICYVGTHDNSTIMGWKKLASKKELRYTKDYFNIKPSDNFAYCLIKGGMASVSNLFVAQMQDYLCLDDSARINTPGTVGINWTWRMDDGMLSESLAENVRKITQMFGR